MEEPCHLPGEGGVGEGFPELSFQLDLGGRVGMWGKQARGKLEGRHFNSGRVEPQEKRRKTAQDLLGLRCGEAFGRDRGSGSKRHLDPEGLKKKCRLCSSDFG